eukprot:TRINITY_DN165_c0_g1_i14.p1 TRINITY_DN165_c0_g1~~TRINITY_DN165_c0_g1_i14.p1  ORF type:complete len:641 (+),score=10.37 TRINITY_DN165_c0_g1_i14:878-2800(+)
MCDAKSPPTRKSVIIEINIRQEQYIITIIMNLMLREISILLLLTMASVCRAMASWSVTPPNNVEVMVLTKENHIFLFGTQLRSKSSSVGLSAFEYDADGKLVQSTTINTTELIAVKGAIVAGDNFILLERVIDKERSGDYYCSLRKITGKAETVWRKKLPQQYYDPNFYLLRGKEGYLVASMLGIASTHLTMVNEDGEILWSKTYDGTNTLKGAVKSGEGYFLAMSLTHACYSQITCINTDGELQGSLVMKDTVIDAITESGSGSVALICHINGIPCIVKVSHNCTVQMKTVIDIVGILDLNSIIQRTNGEYVAAGSSIIDRIYGGILVKFYPEGLIKWKKNFPSSSILSNLLEAEPNTYYMVSLERATHSQSLIKYTLPKYAEGLHCAKYEQCRACGLGFYWNYTSCVPCSVGCVECLDIDHCINCSSRYAKTEDNRCIPVEEPCNCDLPNLTPECREKCALPVCSSNSSLPFTYKTDNKKVCTCPDEMLSNETHCLPKTDVGCHPLCDICAGEYCLQCKNITGIFVSRTHSIAVKCQCDYGYQFNSTACIPVKRIHNVQSSESLVAIALGIIGGLVAVGSVAFIMYLKYRRDEWMHGENLPDIQTGKEQHTVEVSKEMEVHAITRDDERTGEIMFKRE